MERISKEDFLEPLGETLAIINEAQLKMAGKTLYMFPSSAIGILAPMMLKASSSVVRAVLSKVVEGLAARDFRPLERVLENGNEELLCQLVPLLGHMKDSKSAQALLNMARHPSARVRRLGLKTVISRELWAPERLMSLIDDESEGVRQLFLRYLGAHKNEAAETQLLIYLRDRKDRRGDQRHLMACFRALGRCGMGKSLPFLQDTLLSGSWLSKFFSSPRREGAAVALAELGLEESEESLEAACQSRYPGIRRAAQFAVSRGGVSGDMP
jgi:HEAT repeat protein